jgi:hypothetical protein
VVTGTSNRRSRPRARETARTVTKRVTSIIVEGARPRDDAASEISESSATEVEIAASEYLGGDGGSGERQTAQTDSSSVPVFRQPRGPPTPPRANLCAVDRNPVAPAQDKRGAAANGRLTRRLHARRAANAGPPKRRDDATGSGIPGFGSPRHAPANGPTKRRCWCSGRPAQAHLPAQATAAPHGGTTRQRCWVAGWRRWHATRAVPVQPRGALRPRRAARCTPGVPTVHATAATATP